MSADMNDAAFAVGCDGEMFINVAHVDSQQPPLELLKIAMAQGGQLFIGVALDPDEVDYVIERLSHGTTEAAGFVIGARLRRSSKKR